MMSANRFAWNFLAECTKGTWHNKKKADFDKELRPYPKKDYIKSADLVISDCPEEYFDSAYQDFYAACKGIKALSKAKKEKGSKGFEYPEALNFRSKKKGNARIEIRPRRIEYNRKKRTLKFFPKYLGSPIAMRTDLKNLDFKYSCTLCIKNDHYYLLVPHNLPRKPCKKGSICSLDPGVRTFLTGYDPEGKILEISNNFDHISKKKRRIESLQRKDNPKNRKEIRRLYQKITNCIGDLHHKASKFLSEKYERILLPVFETSRMVAKDKNGKKRRIGPKTSDELLYLSHYKFQQLLKHKMEQRKGKLILCTGEYTSKTCGNCERLNHSLGSSKVFSCKNCNIIIDRDYNAARNILVKNIDMVEGSLVYHWPKPLGSLVPFKEELT